MQQSSPTTAERARKISTLIRQRLNDGETQASVAVAIGASEPTVNRLINEHLDKFAAVLAHLGLKVVPAEFKCMDPDAYAFLTSTHAKVMREAPQLIWEREE